MAKEINPKTVLSALKQNHYGRDNGVHAKALAVEIMHEAPTTLDERHIRYAVSELREQGEPICAHPTSGYFYAENTGEINDTCEFLYTRALHSLAQVANLKNKAVPDLRGQLGLENLG